MLRFRQYFCVAMIGALTAGCGNFGGGDTVYPDDDYRRQTGSSYERPEPGLFGNSFSNIFGGGGEEGGRSGGGIGVNSYLWRASLDTLSFLPLASADPFGGVVITDWYSPQEAPDERFKVNLYILGRELRADGLRVSVFRQVRQGQGGWTDANVDPETATQLENAILSRAREMRLATAE